MGHSSGSRPWWQASFSPGCGGGSRSVASDPLRPRQAPLSLGLFRPEYWSGLPFPPPGDLLDPRIKPRSPPLQADAILSEPSRKALLWVKILLKVQAEGLTLKENWIQQDLQIKSQTTSPQASLQTPLQVILAPGTSTSRKAPVTHWPSPPGWLPCVPRPPRVCKLRQHRKTQAYQGPVPSQLSHTGSPGVA